jgi:hypothetical protein
MKYFVCVFCLSIMISCFSKKNKIYYIIKEPALENEAPNGSITPPPPPPGIAYYAPYNFILFDDTTIFFHSKYIYRKCGTGIDYSKPPKLKLETENVTQIHSNDLSKFLENNIPDSISKSQFSFYTISSPVDTIRSQTFEIIVDFYNAIKVKNKIVRKCTEEENYVSIAKKKNLKYDFDKINWKVGFDED